jgi:hypothetical protein
LHRKVVSLKGSDRSGRHVTKGGRIRTSDTIARIRVNQRVALDHSATPSSSLDVLVALVFFPQIISLVARPVAGSFQTANIF